MKLENYKYDHESLGTVMLLHFGENGIRGSENCFIQSAKAFSAKGYRVVVCRNYPVMDMFLDRIQPKPSIIDLQFPEIMIAGRKETSLPLWSYFKSIKKLNSIVKACNPSLIYCNSGLPCQIGVPVGRLNCVPVICHFHHPAIKRAYYLWMVVLADKIIFPSHFTKFHSEKKARVSGEIVHNGIDIGHFHPPGKRDQQLRFKLGIEENAVVIGQVAQLVPHKRQDFLIRAFASLLKLTNHPIHLCLVGKGPMETTLRALVSSLGIEDYVSIAGYVDDVLNYYQNVFDINVLVSREEGLGISSLEGAACGLPVIVTKCTGLAETVIENVTGYTFETNDMNELCDKLLCLIEDPELRIAFGASGREMVKKDFSSEAYDAGVIRVAEAMIRPNTQPGFIC